MAFFELVIDPFECAHEIPVFPGEFEFRCTGTSTAFRLVLSQFVFHVLLIPML